MAKSGVRRCRLFTVHILAQHLTWISCGNLFLPLTRRRGKAQYLDRDHLQVDDDRLAQISGQLSSEFIQPRLSIVEPVPRGLRLNLHMQHVVQVGDGEALDLDFTPVQALRGRFADIAGNKSGYTVLNIDFVKRFAERRHDAERTDGDHRDQQDGLFPLSIALHQERQGGDHDDADKVGQEQQERAGGDISPPRPEGRIREGRRPSR